ncbi:MAG: LysR family transcriptional regulator [Rhizobiaceae bacterium]|nr:LysR family transcriptional regulator [Rhizobiaceae bacterium]
MNINLKLIQTFVLVAKEKSFSKAAEQSARTQPAISNQIKELENQVGFKLFERTSKSVSLSAEGLALLEGAERAMAELGIGLTNARKVADRRLEKVRVACLPTLSSGHLPEIMELARERMPDVSIFMRELNNEDLLEAVRRHEVDFGIGVKVPADDCYLEELGADEMVAIVSENNPHYGTSEIRMADVVKYPILVLPQATPTVLAFRQVSVTSGQEVEIIHRFTQPETLISMALKGVGIAILPWSYVSQKARGKHILRLTSPGLQRQLAVIWSKAHVASSSALALRNITREIISKVTKTQS